MCELPLEVISADVLPLVLWKVVKPHSWLQLVWGAQEPQNVSDRVETGAGALVNPVPQDDGTLTVLAVAPQ